MNLEDPTMNYMRIQYLCISTVKMNTFIVVIYLKL